MFYGKKSLTVVGGAVQTWLGWITFNTGRAIRSKELKTMGLLGVATGSSNLAEGVTNVLYEVTDGKIDPLNPVKHMMEQGFLALGADEGIGEIAYDAVDFGVGVYFGFAVLTKFDEAKQIIHLPVEKKGGGLEKASLLDKLFTAKGIRLFRWGRKDYERKMFVSSKPMLAYKVDNLSIKMLLLLDKHLINDENENN
ncbi:DUF4225 domain-containing protein [Xenorhabdus sp. XENO-7]|uniref:DUF4225 domain-containing protein n=1 Tax=Xenorhabdus aichiensis TaxID=3025874 RepID=A0ABT5MCN6_9GAMM|nr:DUF4225 domain-containing protein [Xenorhabdus aichiensis]